MVTIFFVNGGSESETNYLTWMMRRHAAVVQLNEDGTANTSRNIFHIFQYFLSIFWCWPNFEGHKFLNLTEMRSTRADHFITP